MLLISHDRAFLDNVTTRTIELSLGKVYDYKVPYSKFVVLRAERREQQMAAYENQQRLIEKTEEFIEKFRYKPTKSNQVQSRVKQLEKLERIEVDEEDLSRLNIKFPPAPRSGQIVADGKDVGKAFGEKELHAAIERGAIAILDDATIADMKAKRARDKARDEAQRQQEAVESGQQTDWKAAMEQWEKWEIEAK